MSAVSSAGEQYYREQAILAVLPEWAVARAREIVGKTPERLRDFKCYIATSTAVMLALAAAAAGTQYYNTQKTAQRQDDAMAAQLRQQGKRQQDADAKVNELIAKTAASNPDAEKNDILGKYMQQMQVTGGNATNGLAQVGATSDAYKQSANNAALGIGDYGKHVAGLLSRMDAPAMQRNDERLDAARFESDLNRIKRFSAGDDFLAKLKYDQIRRNPYLDLASGLMSGAAGAMGGGWGTGSTQGASAAATGIGGSFFGNGGLGGIRV